MASAAAYLRGPAVSDELRFRVPIQLSAQTAVAGGAGNVAGAAQGFQGVSGIAVFNPANFAISPDGSRLAFVARQNNAPNVTDNVWFLYVRPLGSVTPQRLHGTEGAAHPFWSADGNSIGFVAAGKLKRIEASGGPPQEIGDVASFNGGTWNAEGVIVFRCAGFAAGACRRWKEAGNHH